MLPPAEPLPEFVVVIVRIIVAGAGCLPRGPLADLGSGFSLVELANVVQLSPRHFSRLFRNSFGTTPYRYVVGE